MKSVSKYLQYECGSSFVVAYDILKINTKTCAKVTHFVKGTMKLKYANIQPSPSLSSVETIFLCSLPFLCQYTSVCVHV